MKGEEKESDDVGAQRAVSTVSTQYPHLPSARDQPGALFNCAQCNPPCTPANLLPAGLAVPRTVKAGTCRSLRTSKTARISLAAASINWLFPPGIPPSAKRNSIASVNVLCVWTTQFKVGSFLQAFFKLAKTVLVRKLPTLDPPLRCQR
jgi:hypothetical protein